MAAITSDVKAIKQERLMQFSDLSGQERETPQRTTPEQIMYLKAPVNIARSSAGPASPYALQASETARIQTHRLWRGGAQESTRK